MITKTAQCMKKRAMKSVTRSLIIKTVLCFMGCIMLFASPVFGDVCPAGDIDGNCQVDINDLRLMALEWLDSGPIP
ncbi:MAG: hypothetical protein KAJ07_12440, partial [Planctomycetes bacterium]|nr:hypothetical protein [Planctomycetota bacterium]